MRNFIISFALLLQFFCNNKSVKECQVETVDYMELNLSFPATVGDAVKIHALQYKPPGYYYKNLKQHNGEVFLTYKYNLSDFRNENQPRETLFPRELESYIFRFPEKEGLEDSLRIELEVAFGKKFINVHETGSPNTVMQQNYNIHFLKINPCLTIGVTSSPVSHKSDRKVVVCFLYNLSESDQLGTMRGYL